MSPSDSRPGATAAPSHPGDGDEPIAPALAARLDAATPQGVIDTE